MRKMALWFAIGIALSTGPVVHARDFIYYSPGYQLKKPVASPDQRVAVAAPLATGVRSTPMVHVVPQPLLAGPVARRVQVNAYFEFDRSQLQPSYEEQLDALANFADQLQPQYGMGRNGFLVGGSIVGHTDHIGSRSYNQALSERRALAAERQLSTRGVDTGRLAVFGMGMDQPIADNSTAAGRTRNRRTEVDLQLITTPDF